jgi:hypothetical protein
MIFDAVFRIAFGISYMVVQVPHQREILLARQIGPDDDILRTNREQASFADLSSCPNGISPLVDRVVRISLVMDMLLPAPFGRGDRTPMLCSPEIEVIDRLQCAKSLS